MEYAINNTTGEIVYLSTAVDVDNPTAAEIAAQQAAIDAHRAAPVYEGPTFGHAGRTFVITVDTIAKAALLSGRKGNGKDVTNKRFRDASGLVYQFTSGQDFEEWLDAAEAAYDADNGWV